MNVLQQIKNFIQSQPEKTRADMEALDQLILRINPSAKPWFFDGYDENGKRVSNPNIGYGSYLIQYADGTNREFFQVGFSPNTAGLSLYIMGLKDKKYLIDNYGEKLGKAKVTGYCIKFKALKDLDLNVLEEAIRYSFEHGGK